MTFNKGRNSKLPGQAYRSDQGPAVGRNRGPSGLMAWLSGLVSALQERSAIKAEQRRERVLARAKGEGYRRRIVVTMLVWMGIFLFAMVYISQHLEGWMESSGGLENFISGNGDAIVDRQMAELEARRKAELAAAAQRARPPQQPQQPKPSRTERLKTGGAIPRAADLPFYSNAQRMEVGGANADRLVLYITSDELAKVAAVTMKLLADDGWGEGVDPSHGQAEDDYFRIYDRDGFQLQARVTIARGLGNETMIQYNIIENQ